MVTKVEAWKSSSKCLHSTREEALDYERAVAAQKFHNKIVGEMNLQTRWVTFAGAHDYLRFKDDLRRILDILDGKLDVSLGIIEG